jgi:anti-sigma B factor antagonist
MLKIKKTITNKTAVFALGGRLDTVTAPELEKEFKESLGDITDLTLDFADLEYISSAGLRVLLAANKTMNKQGSMKLIDVNEIVQEVFEVTGFSDILTIE